MKATTIFIDQRDEMKQAAGMQKSHSRLKRISPFILLTAFLFVLVPYSLITKVIIFTLAKMMWVSFLSANVLLADFAVYNYFAGKKKWLIWIIEAVISALILYWFI